MNSKFIIIIAIVAIASAGIFLSWNLAQGQLFPTQQSQGPQFQINNPIVQGLFDELYTKYPNISQADVDETHRQLTIECMTWTEDEQQDQNVIAQAMTGAFCGGFMHGMMETWLDGIGILYTDPENSYDAPIILQ